MYICFEILAGQKQFPVWRKTLSFNILETQGALIRR